MAAHARERVSIQQHMDSKGSTDIKLNPRKRSVCCLNPSTNCRLLLWREDLALQLFRFASTASFECIFYESE